MAEQSYTESTASRKQESDPDLSLFKLFSPSQKLTKTDLLLKQYRYLVQYSSQLLQQIPQQKTHIDYTQAFPQFNDEFAPLMPPPLPNQHRSRFDSSCMPKYEFDWSFTKLRLCTLNVHDETLTPTFIALNNDSFLGEPKQDFARLIISPACEKQLLLLLDFYQHPLYYVHLINVLVDKGFQVICPYLVDFVRVAKGDQSYCLQEVVSYLLEDVVERFFKADFTIICGGLLAGVGLEIYDEFTVCKQIIILNSMQQIQLQDVHPRQKTVQEAPENLKATQIDDEEVSIHSVVDADTDESNIKVPDQQELKAFDSTLSEMDKMDLQHPQSFRFEVSVIPGTGSRKNSFAVQNPNSSTKNAGASQLKQAKSMRPVERQLSNTNLAVPPQDLVKMRAKGLMSVTQNPYRLMNDFLLDIYSDPCVSSILQAVLQLKEQPKPTNASSAFFRQFFVNQKQQLNYNAIYLSLNAFSPLEQFSAFARFPAVLDKEFFKILKYYDQFAPANAQQCDCKGRIVFLVGDHSPYLTEALLANNYEANRDRPHVEVYSIIGAGHDLLASASQVIVDLLV